MFGGVAERGSCLLRVRDDVYLGLIIVADRIRTRVQMTTDDSRISELPLDCASCKITGGIACFVLGAMSLYNIRTPAWQGKPIARTGVQLFAVGKIPYLFFPC